MNHTGITRTSIQARHALITPESHIPLSLPGWSGAQTIVLISRELGAGFGQYLVHAGEGARLIPLKATNEYLLLVLGGQVELAYGGGSQTLGSDGFAYLPAALDWRLTSEVGAELLLFEKAYVPLAGVASPAAFVSRLDAVPAVPFLGDPGAMLKCLLPPGPEWDWGINVFEFVPGGTLPNVESHFMEHGLFMLAGAGVYRLGEHWYPVQAGDAIWMSPYLLQWFAATGKTNTRYIYYKEMNRVAAV